LKHSSFFHLAEVASSLHCWQTVFWFLWASAFAVGSKLIPISLPQLSQTRRTSETRPFDWEISVGSFESPYIISSG
jgi:hypothetical protein